ncbi:MAG: symmetrical bis(5'-nucleosyl)-tetraphosphatase [Pseudohongiellaceae bacterium]
MSTYVIGDIQGCYKPLKKLLKKVGFSPATDRLWCVGDLVNRGPRSLDTLRYLQDMDEALVVVLGNHDLHFLALHENCAPNRSKDTLDELLESADCEGLAGWLRHKPLVHYEAVETTVGPRNFLMVHAGVAPTWSLQTTLNLAAEVEFVLRDEDYGGYGGYESHGGYASRKNYQAYLANMYGDTPIRWSKKLEGYDRLRTITNYLTRVRFCDDVGSLRLDVKEGFCAAPKGYKPWFEFQRITPEAIILFGHWAAIEGVTGRDDVIALDTGYVWGRELTLIRLEDGRRFNISAR